MLIMYINKNTGEFTYYKSIAEVWELHGDKIETKVVTNPF